jgi:hypothetical protein
MGSQEGSRAVNGANWNGEGGFEPPKPVSQCNGLANRKQSDANTDYKSGLRHINDDLPTSLPTDSCNIDTELAEVMDAWAKLPKAVRDEIVATVRSSRKSGKRTN